MKLLAAFLIALGVMSSANAALYSRAGGTMVYDDVLNITWLADWNYAKTSGYDSDGKMRWSEAREWAANLSLNGYDDWRLPAGRNGGPGLCVIYEENCSSSLEFEYMYYVNWGAVNAPTPSPLKPQPYYSAVNGPNLEMFKNVIGYNYNFGTPIPELKIYWTDLSFVINAAIRCEKFVWFFSSNGAQDAVEAGCRYFGLPNPNEFFAVAVRDGDVSDVPVPATLALLGLGLVGMAYRSRLTGKGAKR